MSRQNFEPQPKRVKLDSDNLTVDQIPYSATHDRLTEAQCGISVYLNENLPRFKCTLKEQTSDFQVFEVNKNGQVLRLTDVPKPETLKLQREEARVQQQEKEAIIEAKTFSYDTETAVALEQILGVEIFDKLKSLVTETQEWHGHGANAPLPVITEVIDDKDRRTTIHKGIREVFLGCLESRARDDKKMAITPKVQGSAGKKGGGRGKRQNSPSDRRAPAWPYPGDYTLFTVYKDGRDTMDVISTICRITKLPSKVFGFAGTKDRRGCTVQQFTAWRTPIHRLATLNGNGAMKGIVLGDFTYTQKGLSLGDLRGNRFILALRDIQGSTDEELEASFASIKAKGFVNYYGLQRFGTSSTGTHEVGIKVLQGKFEDACNLILSEHSGAWKETKEAKLNWIATHDAAATLAMMPLKCIAEVSMLKHISKAEQKNDWHGAFNTIPRNLRMMYAHAYQSLVWNNVVTERLTRYGTAPIAGDLVLTEEDVTEEGKAIPRARPLTEAELSDFSMYDIVLPLPGYDIVYPANDLKNVYITFMLQHDLNPDDMVRGTKQLSLLGSYRKVLSKPIDLEWQILKYSDAHQQLIATNLDELNTKTVELPKEGSQTAIRIGFQLESAAYATMLLREALASVPFSI